jgi:hypothetical protein
MDRSNVERGLRRSIVLATAVVLAGCSGGTAATAPAPAPTTTSVASNAPVASTAVGSVQPTKPQPSPTVITPPSVAEGKPLKELWTYQGTPDSFTWAPAMDPKGRIWVAAFSANAFWVLDRDGKLVDTWGEEGSGDGQISIKGDLGHVFGSIAFGRDGSFVVGDGGHRRVEVFDADRRFVRSFGTFGNGDGQFVAIMGVSVAPDGSIVVADGDRLNAQVFDPSGAYVRTICAEPAEGDAGVVTTVDASGTTWCLYGDQLEAWSRDGVHTSTVDLHGIITLGIGMTIAPNGHLFVASVDQARPVADQPERLLELDAKGTLLHVWPTGGEGIAIDPAGDRIYVSSIDLKRVRAYALPGA